MVMGNTKRKTGPKNVFEFRTDRTVRRTSVEGKQKWINRYTPKNISKLSDRDRYRYRMRSTNEGR